MSRPFVYYRVLKIDSGDIMDFVEFVVVVMIIGVLAVPKFDMAIKKSKLYSYIEEIGLDPTDENILVARRKFSRDGSVWKHYNGDKVLVGDSLVRSLNIEVPPKKPAMTVTVTRKPVQNKVKKVIERDETHKKISDDVYILYTNDALTTLKVIDTIRSATGKQKYEILEEMSDGIVIKMKW